MNNTKLEDWFDIHSKEHLLALKYFRMHGDWPKHFMPADVLKFTSSIFEINMKIIRAWTKHLTEPIYIGKYIPESAFHSQGEVVINGGSGKCLGGEASHSAQEPIPSGKCLGQ